MNNNSNYFIPGVKQNEINKFFTIVDNLFLQIIATNTQEFIELLPKELATDTKVAFLQKFGETITKDNFIEFLCKMTYSGDYVSINYLCNHYKINNSKVNGILIPNLQFTYRQIRQGAFYLHYILSIIQKDTFLNKYYNTNKLAYICEDAIETNILPLQSNFKFDLAFINLHILIEINEYAHESKETKKNDNVKKALATLCGYDLVSLHVSKIFNISETEYNKLSDMQIHDLLSKSIYLKKFAYNFIYKITSALLTCDNVSDDFIMMCFKKHYNNQKCYVHSRLRNENYKIKNYIMVLQNSTTLSDSIYVNKYNESLESIECDKKLIVEIDSVLSNFTTNKNILTIFKLKERCAQSKNPSSEIKFIDLVDILDIKINDEKSIYIFKKFLRNESNIIEDIDIDINSIYMSWENLSEIISNWSKLSEVKKLLELYYREVGRSYDLIINMIKSHTSNLTSTKIILNTYTKHLYKKLLKQNETLLVTNKVLKMENELLVKQHNKQIKDHKKEYNILYERHNTHTIQHESDEECDKIIYHDNTQKNKTIIDAYLARIKNTDDDDLINKINKLEIVNDDDELE